MSSIQGQLDSLTESVVCIQFNEDDAYSVNSESEIDDEDDFDEMFTSGTSMTRDILAGKRLRREAYEQAWSNCERRVMTAIHDIQVSTTRSLVNAVQNSYQDALPLLPFTELPVFVVSGMDRSVTAAICQDVREVLVKADNDEIEAYAAILSATECNNISNTMKSVVSKFVAHHPPSRSNLPATQAKQPASFSLAAYDVNILKAWYEVVAVEENDKPRLLVFMRDFEQYDPSVISQLFYICAQCIPELPFVFILSLSTPITPFNSYIHSNYSRQVLALLKIKSFRTKDGTDVLAELIKETFFSTNFQPDIFLGASTIDYISRQCSRYATCTDLMITILKLVHLRHFSEPLTAFVHNVLLGEDNVADAAATLEEADSHEFVRALAARLHHPEKAFPNGIPDTAFTPLEEQETPRKGKSAQQAKLGGWRLGSVHGLLELARKSRESVYSHARQSRFAFSLFDVVRSYLVQHGLGYRKNANVRSAGDGGMSLFEMMAAALKGTLISKEGKYMGLVIRKLTVSQLQQLMSRVYEFLHQLPSDLRQEHKAASLKLVKWMNASVMSDPEDPSTATGNTSSCAKLGEEFSEWLLEYISERMTDISELNLWDIWYTGSPSTISELLNPSPRETIITGLLHPDEYLQHSTHPDHPKVKTSTDDSSTAISFDSTYDLTTVFRLYLESGKTINVYDWCQAFQVKLETERRTAAALKKAGSRRKRAKNVTNGKGRKGTDAQKSSVPVTPSKRGRRKSVIEETPTKSRSVGRPRKGKTRQGEFEDDSEDAGDAQSDTAMDVDVEMTEEESERWHREVLFRFMRSIQELDYLGFLKPARRKRDHVGKTVFDLPE